MGNPEWWQIKIINVVTEYHFSEYLAELNNIYGAQFVEKTFRKQQGEKLRELLWLSRNVTRGRGFSSRQGFVGLGEGFYLRGEEELLGLMSVSDEFRIEVASITRTGFLKKRILEIEEALEATPSELGFFQTQVKLAQEAHLERIQESQQEDIRFQSRVGDINESPPEIRIEDPQTYVARPAPGLRRERDRKNSVETEKIANPIPHADERKVLKLTEVEGVSNLVAGAIYQTPGLHLKGVQFQKKVVGDFVGDSFVASTFDRFQKKLLTYAEHRTHGIFERMITDQPVYAVRILGVARGEYRLLGCLIDGVFIAMELVDHKSLNPRAKQIVCLR